MHNVTNAIQKVTWLSMFVNILLTSTKFVAGIIGNSQAVIADAAHSLSDIVTDGAILIGSYYWSNPPDSNHPYGHHRIETLVTVFIGFMLFATSVGLGYRAVTSILHGSGSIQIEGPLIVTISSIILKEILYQITKKTALKINSSALLANAHHQRSDALSSLPVLIALLLSWLLPELKYIDHIGAIIVSLFIAKTAWEVSAPAISELTEKSAPQHIIDQIEEHALKTDGVVSVHAIRTRKFGSYYNMDLHIQVDPSISVHDGHVIAGKVKAALLKCHCGINDVIIHIEPDES